MKLPPPMRPFTCVICKRDIPADRWQRGRPGQPIPPVCNSCVSHGTEQGYPPRGGHIPNNPDKLLMLQLKVLGAALAAEAWRIEHRYG